MSSEAHSGLRVFIIGAGVAGLSASITLRRAGHEVTIFERSKFKSEIGAAISITPNGSRVLERWGFDIEKAGAVESERMKLVLGANMQVLHEEAFQMRSRYGYGLYHYHRVDLHRELRELAESLGVQIEVGSLVDDVKADGTVKVLDKTLTADLVVVADGVHSRLLSKVTGKDEPLIFSGRSCIRALVPQDKIRSDPETAEFFGQQSPHYYVPCTMPPDPTQMVTYPCRANNMLNIAVIHNTLPGYEDRDDWHSPITLEDALKPLEGFHPACRKVMGMADSLKVYALTIREVLPNYVNGRLVVVGDAAHVMPPIHAQGGVTGLEEACALGVFFDKVQDPAEVQERLELYQKLVMPRMQTVQLLSSALPGQNSKFRQQAEQVWEASGRGKLYPDTAMYMGPEVGEFFYMYDMYAEAEKAMKDAGHG